MVVDGEVVVKIETPTSFGKQLSDDAASKTKIVKENLSEGNIHNEESSKMTKKNVFKVNADVASPVVIVEEIKSEKPKVQGALKMEDNQVEENEDDLWVNSTTASGKKKKLKSASSQNGSSSKCIHAASVQISLNMMDVIEDHKVLQSLAQDLLMQILQKTNAKMQRRAASKL